MFGTDFYPTPENIIERMLNGEQIEGRTILEPSAGKGNIVDYLLNSGAASVLACETNEDLRKILATKCTLIGGDFLKLESHQVSHINLIVMNPPFSADEKHLLHAYNIAPAGCRIVALCNLNMVKNQYTNSRKELGALIEDNGSFEDLGECFNESERHTRVEVALVKLQKAGENYSAEFEGFLPRRKKKRRASG